MLELLIYLQTDIHISGLLKHKQSKKALAQHTINEGTKEALTNITASNVANFHSQPSYFLLHFNLD